jgi:hypothetical protein
MAREFLKVAESDLLRLFVLTIGAASLLLFGTDSRAGNPDTHTKSYPNPQMNGASVDWCESWATNCGQTGADQFCRSLGFERASQWRWDYVDRTWVIGSNQFCEARRGCGALLDVICARAAIPASPPSPDQSGSAMPNAQPGSPSPSQAGQSCDFAGVWQDDLGSSFIITQRGGAINASGLFLDIRGDISFSGNVMSGGVVAKYAPCPGNASPHLQTGGRITLNLSGCNDLSGVLDDNAGQQLFDFSLKRASDTPSSDSSCAAGSASPSSGAPSP